MHGHTTGAEESIRCQLAAETLRSSGSLRLRVTGSSMLPAVWPGDVLHIQRREIREVRTGDIALFERYGRLVAHRVIECRGSSFLAKGDTLHFPDPPVTCAELLGTVTGIVRGGRAFRPSRRPGLPGRMTATLVRRGPQAARLMERARSLLLRVSA